MSTGQKQDWVDAAFTYAWWLTGDDDAAEAAVTAAAAAATPLAPGRGRAGREEVATLLQAVRSAAGGGVVMSRAGEIALLHDVAGISLGHAARITSASTAEAESLLANGRLEALPSAPDVAPDHPERLGGLAVGNRRDVSHARGCDTCRRMTQLIERGRDELVAIAAVPAPPALRERLVPAPSEEPEADVEAPAPDVATAVPPTEPTADEAAVEAPPAEPEVTPAKPDTASAEPEAAERQAASPIADVTPPEPDTAPPEPEDAAPDVDTAAAQPAVEVDDGPPQAPAAEDDPIIAIAASAPPADEQLLVEEPLAPDTEPEPDGEPVDDGQEEVEPQPNRRFALLLVAVGLALVVVAALLWLFRPDDDPAVEEPPGVPQTEPGAATRNGDASEPTEGAQGREGDATEPAATGGFQVVDAGVIPTGEEEPAPSGTTVPADEPLRLSVDYRGAQRGVELEAEWMVDGELYRAPTVTLDRRAGRHIFVGPVPAGGWPLGAHHIVLTTDDGIVGSIDFVVE